MSFKIIKYDQKPILLFDNSHGELVSAYTDHIRYDYMGTEEHLLKYCLQSLYTALFKYSMPVKRPISVEGNLVMPYDKGQLLKQFTKLIVEPIMALAESDDVKEKSREQLSIDNLMGAYEIIEGEFLLPYTEINGHASERVEQIRKPICYNLREFISHNFNLSLPSWHKRDADKYYKYQQKIAHMNDKKPFLELLKY